MATSTRKISTLVEQQLPKFISSEYENFSRFVEKYYEQLELTGQPLDIINNITKYRDINFYEENILNQYNTLTTNIDSFTTSISVEDASSFPKENGYIRINDEICFYKTKIDNEFIDVSRGVSGNTTLGDLYNTTTFVTTEAADHSQGDVVYNISNLFLYAFVKSFEEQYLGSFPEKYLKGKVDKRTLIKNISDFYKAKGTDRSIKFIFNSIVSRSANDVPEIYNPKDFTLKASISDWINTYSLKVKILSGNPEDLIGNEIIQSLDVNKPEMKYASAVVDNIIPLGNINEENLYQIVLDPSSLNGQFDIAAKTTLTKSLSSSLSENDRINVISTLGMEKKGKILIDNEIIAYKNKNVSQLIIEQRGNNLSSHSQNIDVYSYSILEGNGVKILPLGILYNLNVKSTAPYLDEKDAIQISDAGFETKNPIIYDVEKNSIRWIINENNQIPSVPSNSAIQSAISQLNADVVAIYEDDQYYYICSSGYPSQQILTAEFTDIPEDGNLLRIIRKQPITTTEVYKTGNRDVGIFVDGTLAFSHKDSQSINFGKIKSINITKSGGGYKSAPFVLVNNQPNKARAFLSGDVVESIEILTEENYNSIPNITITAGRNAQVRAIVTSGKVTSLVVVNPGEYYSSPPSIIITDLSGKGKFAEFNAIVSPQGQLVGFEKIDEGKFYTQENIVVSVVEDAKNNTALAKATIETWTFNRFKNLEASSDDSYGNLFDTYTSLKTGIPGYIYGRFANPKRLRVLLQDNLTSTFAEPPQKIHSPIVGFAYDGNPIYGPFGYENPGDASSNIIRLSSGYSLKSTRQNGPSVTQYPLGSFVEDYQWVASVNSGKTVLDQNNGRFCVTPDYPEGIYAYFITIDSSNVPVYPYILGENYYSLPVSSNYDSDISQDQVPLKAKRLRTLGIENNGSGVYAYINTTNSGSVSSITTENSTNTFEVGSAIYFDNSQTFGEEVSAVVSSVKGESVVSLECNDTKAVQLSTSFQSYYFKDDIIVQQNSNAYGQIIGDVFNDTQIILRNVVGNFNTIDKISSTINVINCILNKNSSFTKGSTISLTDGINSPVATGLILESTNNQNTVKIRIFTGSFANTSPNLFLRSSELIDTVGSEIIEINSLSQNISIASINDNIAIVETEESHGLTKGDKINVKVFPDDNLTETTYYVRKRYYQKLILSPLNVESKINDSGIGRFDLLNSGSDYATGTYTNVELIFQNTSLSRPNIGYPGAPNNAKATIVVSNLLGSNYGRVVNVTITNKGNGYKKGDILTVLDANLNRLISSINTQRLTLVVDHVGISKQNTTIKLSSVNGFSQNDLISINQEVLRINSINELNKTISVTRGVDSTTVVDHYDSSFVRLKNSTYRFFEGQRILGTDANDPYVFSYDEDSKELLLAYDYPVFSPRQLTRSSTFYDNSSPQKLVTINSVNLAEYRLEFSKDNQNFEINPILEIQKYYKYKFDTSHFSMNGVYLDFSSSQNQNIITQEKFVNEISPGVPGSFVSLKLGFGANISSNDFTKPFPVNFINYFYYIKGLYQVNTENSYLKVVDDPLTGEKEIIYSTDKKFVYPLKKLPQYDGSGDINYTTNSTTSIGKINTVLIQNAGKNYKKIPIILGASIAEEYKAIIEVTYNGEQKNIISVSILNGGKNYSKPKILVVDGDGFGAKFDIITKNGSISAITVLDGGKNYSYAPKLEVIETDVKLYANSNTIGTPQTITIIDNGRSFHNDKTLYSSYKSSTSLLLKDIEVGTIFYSGETIVQTEIINGSSIVVASGKVCQNGWRPGSNILKLEKIKGTFDKKLPIKGKLTNKVANIIAILSAEFDPVIKTYFDNQGSYLSDRGKLGSFRQRLTDSDFYQDYSYVIKSKTPIDIWRDLIKETTHPAGFKVFGEVIIESDGSALMPIKSPKETAETIRIIDLRSKDVSIVSTKKTITETILNFEDLNIEKGIGSISVNTVDNTETRAGEVILSSDFNGAFDPLTGQIIGNNTFVLLDKNSNLPINPYNEQQLIITLDGVLQEPGVAYTVSNSQITFASPPFGQRIVEGQIVEAQKFYCRYFKFKNDNLNERYLRKLKSISEYFDGIETTFDLYYEDNGIVKTDNNENLIVTLNGVLQKAKNKDNEPFENSYKIIRNENPNITDKIEFTSAPIKHENLYDEVYNDLELAEKSFIFTIGSYLRLTINPKLLPIKGGGPFLLQDEVTNRVAKIDDTNFAFVFVDGVLQKPSESYIINGSTITFFKPLNYYISESGDYVYQDVSVLLLYGRNTNQILTAFDFEPDTYYNKTTITFEDQNVYNQFLSWYGNTILLGSKIWVYQDKKCLGTLLSYNSSQNNQWKIILMSQNTFYDSNLPLCFTRYSSLNDSSDLILNNPTFIDLQYQKDVDNSQIYEKFVNDRIVSDEEEWISRTKITANLHPGDLIKIDGENDYREVISVPLTVNTKDYRNNTLTTNSIYGKVRATNYNGITRGEGLNVVATIENGEVTKLDWNRRELELYYEYGILLQPNEYQYYTEPELNFIPLDGNGGGAKAQVIVSDGYVVDIVLINGGSEYTVPPKVVVARKFDKIKKNDRKVISVINFNTNPVDDDIEQNRSLYVKLEALISNILITNIGRSIDVASTSSSITFGSFADVNLGIQITSGFSNEDNVSFEKEFFPYELTATIGVDYPVAISQTISKEVVNIISTPIDIISSSSIENVSRNITKQISFTIDNKFTEQIYDSTSDVGAYLEIPLSETDNIVYVKNTSAFPYSSRLLIGKEIVTYQKKLDDRFLEVARGTYGTLATTHEAGDYLRHLPELVSIVPVGPEVNIITEVKVTEIHETSSSFKNLISLSEKIDFRFLTSKEIDRDGSRTLRSVFGSIDYIEEKFIYDNNVNTREDGVIILNNPIKEILLRDQSIILVRNTTDKLEYFNKLEFGNVGFNIKIFENNAFIEEKGDFDAITLEQLEIYSSALTIEDFENRPSCSVIGSGDVFNITLPSIITPVNICSTDINLDTTVIVPVSKATTMFDSNGKLFVSLNGIYSLISYTGKTNNSFTGCVLISGSNEIFENSIIVPYFD